MIKAVSNVEKDPETGEKTILVRVTNTSIRMIKSAVNFYQGDNDDLDNVKKQNELRNDVHSVWKLLNPS